jgi:ribosomal protein S17
MTKAISVVVYKTKRHPKYKKTYKVRNKYLVACNDSNNFVINQTVEFVETRPISKRIKFKVIEN